MRRSILGYAGQWLRSPTNTRRKTFWSVFVLVVSCLARSVTGTSSSCTDTGDCRNKLSQGEIDNSTFSVPEHLKRLDLGVNRISNIPSRLFNGDALALQLTTLILDKNEISSLYVAPCSRPVPYSCHSPYSRHFVQHLVVFLQGFNNSL